MEGHQVRKDKNSAETDLTSQTNSEKDKNDNEKSELQTNSEDDKNEQLELEVSEKETTKSDQDSNNHLTPFPPLSPSQSLTKTTDVQENNLTTEETKAKEEEESKEQETTPNNNVTITNKDESSKEGKEENTEVEVTRKEEQEEKEEEGEKEEEKEEKGEEKEITEESEEGEIEEEPEEENNVEQLISSNTEPNDEGEESRDQTTPTAQDSSSPSNGCDDDRATPTEEGVAIEIQSTRRRSVRFSDDVQQIMLVDDTTDQRSTTQLNDESQDVAASTGASSPSTTADSSLPGIPQMSPEQLIEGVVYQAQYLGSTPIIFSSSQKTVRMQQAREAVQLIKDPENETQPRIDVELKISTKSIIIADKKTETDLMTHPLRTVSYVADIEGSLVMMVHRTVPASPEQSLKLTCHVLDTLDPRIVAMVIGQAFSTAYKEFLKSHGIKEESMDQFEYQHVLNSQTKSEVELNSLKDEDKTKEITFAKQKGDILGLVVIDSGYGSIIPSCIVAHMNKTGSASQSGLINVGDQILSINGVSLVGMPLKIAIEQIKKCRYLTVVKMITCCCPAVVDVTIMRPDLKYQLGFSVKEGNICSLWRGSIAERSGIRVGHRIIEINGTSAVGLSHEEMVHMLSTTVGDLHIRTMPIVLYQLLTGQLTPEYY